MTGWLMWWWTNYTRSGQEVAARFGGWLLRIFTRSPTEEDRRTEEGTE